MIRLRCASQGLLTILLRVSFRPQDQLHRDDLFPVGLEHGRTVSAEGSEEFLCLRSARTSRGTGQRLGSRAPLDQACFSEGGTFWSAFSVAVL